MKKQFTSIKNVQRGLKKASLVFLFYLVTTTAFAQNFSLPLTTGYPIGINYLNGNTICSPTSATVSADPSYAWVGSFYPPITADMISSNEGTRHLAVAREDNVIIVEVINAGMITTQNQNGLFYKYGEADGNSSFPQLSAPPVISPTNPDNLRWELPFNFESTTQNGFLSFVVKDGEIGNGLTGNLVVMPFTVIGATDNNVEVPILDTITEPQIPYLVLHAPPGDGSSSVFQENKTTCRKMETNYAEDNSTSANVAVKVGYKGTAGIFVTTDFEVSFTVSAGLTEGQMEYTSTAEETCITVSEGFETGSMLDADDLGGGDVFVGYGTDYYVGIYEYLKIDENLCASVLDTGLVYAPKGGTLRKFAKTTAGIQSSIAELELIVADSSNLEPKTVNDAQNQIDVWNQVLTMNQNNINNPGNELIENLSIDAPISMDRETSIQIETSNTIEYEQYVNTNLGFVAKVEVAGSGVTGGLEFKGSKRFGASQNQTDITAKLVKYTIGDDDLGDQIKMQIVRDPMYGTPIFRVDENQTQTSCPYQAGYQRDQPLLTLVDGSQEITLADIPDGETATFQLKICNDSDEDRTYYLKGNSNTNLDGLIIKGFSSDNLFSGNDQGVEFYLIPANDCLNAATITVEQSNNVMDYEDIELYLNVDCQPATAPITSSIFLNAHFIETTNLSDFAQEDASMTIVPNPNVGQFTILLKGATVDGQLFLTDVTGKTIHQQQVASGETSIAMNQRSLSPGVYILVFQNGTSRTTQKLVIEH
ncbi:MAG: T9SS type A sorting domain-containing protein [Saprospiraceae bacterium]